MRLSFIVISLLLAGLCHAAVFDVVVDGKPATTIVTPDAPLPVVTAAAEELRYHIRKASGAEVAIVGEKQAPAGSPLIYLGPCAATHALGLKLGDLQPNGCFIRLSGGNLYLLGDDTAGDVFWILHGNRTRVGTLFGVYELLEKRLGVRWLWPGSLGEVVPQRDTIRLQITDQTVQPRFVHTRWRDGGIYMAGTKGWANQQARSTFLNEQGKWLRRHRFAMGINMDMAHAFTNWWDRFSTDHPEYFNLLPDGTRRSDPLYHGGSKTLISMSVGELAFWRQKIADWAAKRSPQAPHVDASENDTAGKCVCPKCLALDVPDPENPVSFEKRVEKAKERFAAGEADWFEALGSMSDRYARYYLALQKEAEKIDPQAVVMGYAYANYVRPPLQTKLNPRIIIGIVPALMYPWTAEKRKDFIEQWQGWSAAGARLLLRPNYMLDGHCLPLNIARPLGEDFSFAVKHGLIGTDFDSLTGQYSTQGPNLYMLARLHEAPDLTPEQVLGEYYAGFGKAAKQVQTYFEHWAAVSAAVTEKQYDDADLHWSRFYRDADTIFNPAAMTQGRKLLQAAVTAASGDAEAGARLGYLEAGLRNAELTLATQRAFREYRKTGDLEGYTQAMQALDAFRAEKEADLIANMAYLAWSESITWDRDLLRLMAQPGTRLPDPWQFMFDPQGRGEQQTWYAVDFDSSKWQSIGTAQAWEHEEPGRHWKAKHGEDYNGIAWYRTSFTVSPKPDEQVRLVFGAVDEACKIWLNGQLILERPYPFEGDTESWRQSFEIDITKLIARDKPNVLAVQVTDTGGAGGVWKPVWLVTSEAPAAADRNLLKNGGFEAQAPVWGQNVQCGVFKFSLDTTRKRSGASSGMVQCTELGEPEVQQKTATKAWGRWYQTGLKVEPAKTYRLRAWYRTDPSFAGTVKFWVRVTKAGTAQAQALNTQGLWREVRLEHLKPAEADLSVYLNVTDATGSVWFDDVELVAEQ